MRPTAASGFPSQTILIVDDTPANVGVLVDYLEDQGFRVVVAQDGEEGLQRALFALPDLILLDVMMPGTDGFETCRRLKANHAVRDIPVIFMTALADSTEKVNGFSVGAVDYVTKPFQIEEVLARINTHLSLRSMQRQLAEQNLRLQQEIDVRVRAEADLLLTQFSVDHAADAVFWLAPDGRLTYVNEAACRLLKHSRESLLALHATDIQVDVAPADWSGYWARIKERRSATFDTRVRTKNGMIIPLEVTLSYLAFSGSEHVFAYARDISERTLAERALRDSYAELKQSKDKLEELHQHLLQSEKLASIGQLAAGVAHEINNPIAFVNSNLGALQDYVADLLGLLALYQDAEENAPGQPRLLENARLAREKLDMEFVRRDLNNLLAESLDGLQRVRRIVQDLKDFSRVGETGHQLIDLHPGLDSTLNIVSGDIRGKAQIRKEYGKLPLIEAGPAQLNQVFLNLLINASQAIAEEGIITIRTGHEPGWVWVEIADTGSGIQPEHIDRIFEPFFTTKPVGQGTGLGLSLSYGIVTRHGGRIEVHSVVGEGTAFRVWLPAPE